MAGARALSFRAAAPPRGRGCRIAPNRGRRLTVRGGARSARSGLCDVAAPRAPPSIASAASRRAPGRAGGRVQVSLKADRDSLAAAAPPNPPRPLPPSSLPTHPPPKNTQQEWHQETLDNLRTAMARTHLMCATVMDTLGPEIVVINRCVVALLDSPLRSPAANDDAPPPPGAPRTPSLSLTRPPPPPPTPPPPHTHTHTPALTSRSSSRPGRPSSSPPTPRSARRRAACPSRTRRSRARASSRGAPSSWASTCSRAPRRRAPT
jgi:hypothetical protein